MYLGNTFTVPNIVNLPGQAGGAPAFEYTAIDNSYSMEFDGDAYVFSPLDGTSLTDLSISMWFKIASVPPLSSSANNVLFAWANALSTFYAFVRLKFNKTSNQTDYRITFNNTAIESNIIAEADLTNWHHLALVRDNASTTWTMYLDGVSQGTYNDGGSPPYQNRAAELYIGKNYPSGWNGNIDEVVVWTTKLEESTIQAIYDTTANNPGKVADLSETPEGVPTAWYRMGD